VKPDVLLVRSEVLTEVKVKTVVLGAMVLRNRIHGELSHMYKGTLQERFRRPS
jgi:hypothetical protein